ncbi:hypothetical protein AVEN_131393-1 [Araneus ventricosus]|uniref:Uncharacterized protein n=1 Tax=Araneus ventricosus TaxID=182803 RepID=A0A4Y2ILB0_ARAVE|nr:hypothetical protein AVEN_131393-1 [Araneus ventricosus]
MDAEDTVNPPLPPLVKSASRSSLDEGISWFHGKITRDAAEHILEINSQLPWCYNNGGVDLSTALTLMMECTSLQGFCSCHIRNRVYYAGQSMYIISYDSLIIQLFQMP